MSRRVMGGVVRGAAQIGRERVGTFRLLFLVRLLQWPVRAATRPLLRRVRRDSNLIAFGADSDRFADNAAYLFVHMSTASPARCVWISGSQRTVDHIRSFGHEAHRRWSWHGVRVAARAGWYVFSSYRSDINVWLSDGAQAFNLWHGVGVKPVQRGRTTGEGAALYHAREGSLRARVFYDDRNPPDWQLTTSPLFTEIFSHQFGVPPDRCVELGYPRDDHLVAGGVPPREMVDDDLYAAMSAKRPVVGYFPTFRDDSASIPGGAPVISEMSEIVARQGGLFVFKPHDASVVPGVADTGSLVLPKEADLSAYLGLCDVLVTDYSSVQTDFLHLRRPIVLFCPDFEEYRSGRGFNFDPAEMLPGVLTRTKDELYALLADLAAIPLHADAERLAKEYWASNGPPGASERTARFILESG